MGSTRRPRSRLARQCQPQPYAQTSGKDRYRPYIRNNPKRISRRFHLQKYARCWHIIGCRAHSTVGQRLCINWIDGAKLKEITILAFFQTTNQQLMLDSATIPVLDRKISPMIFSLCLYLVKDNAINRTPVFECSRPTNNICSFII